MYVLHIYITKIVQQRETTTEQKWLCRGRLACLVNIANYAVLCAVELSVREQITCKWRNDSFLSNKINIPPSQALNQKLQWTEKNFKKLLG